MNINYTPLMAIVTPSRNNPENLMALIGSQACFFERDADITEFKAGDEIEVMITRPHHLPNPEGHPDAGKPNFSKLVGLMIRPVDREIMTLVCAEGFRHLEGYHVPASYIRDDRDHLLSRGKTGARHHRNDNPTHPINVWVLKTDLNGPDGIITTQGLSSIYDGQWRPHVDPYRYGEGELRVITTNVPSTVVTRFRRQGLTK